jgi:DNA mismatch repair protein MSH4
MSKCHVTRTATPSLTPAGDQAVEDLIEEVRGHMSIMFKICEAVALLDMVRHIAPELSSNSLTASRLHHSLNL